MSSASRHQRGGPKGPGITRPAGTRAFSARVPLWGGYTGLLKERSLPSRASDDKVVNRALQKVSFKVRRGGRSPSDSLQVEYSRARNVMNSALPKAQMAFP